jgi:hypothetical protein
MQAGVLLCRLPDFGCKKGADHSNLALDIVFSDISIVKAIAIGSYPG